MGKITPPIHTANRPKERTNKQTYKQTEERKNREKHAGRSDTIIPRCQTSKPRPPVATVKKYTLINPFPPEVSPLRSAAS